MSDYNSSLPVRTENNGDVAIKVVDGTLTSQALTVNADGSVNITDNAGSLTVDAVNLDIRDLAFATDKVDVSGSEVSLDSATLAALENITVSATDLDIRDLAFATDKVDVSGSEVSLDSATLAALENITVSATDLDIRDLAFATDKVDVSGSSVTVTATNLDIRDLAFATDKVDVSGSEVSLDSATLAALENITVSATDLDIRDLAFATDSVDVSGSSVTVSSTDLDIRDLSHTQDSVKIGDGTDFLAVNTDGSINVVISDSTPGTAINDFATSVAVAAAASVNHDYTVTALKTLMLNQVECSASGKIKVEIKVNAVTKFVQFNSTADTNTTLHIDNPITATAGQVVRVTITNLDKQAQDVYSTICGFELP